MKILVRYTLALLLVASCSFAFAANTANSAQSTKFAYQKPPKIIRDVLESPAPPITVVSPTHDRVLVIDSLRQPPISDLAQPMLRIAGLRINPATNARHHPPHHVGLRLMAISNGHETRLAVPPNAWLSVPQWAPDGKHFAFTNTTANATELWIGDAATGAMHRVTGIKINATYGEPVQWMPGSRALLVQLVPAHRGAPPAAASVPYGPNVQESSSKAAPVRTYEDLLQTAHDADLFNYYVTSQLANVDVATEKITPVGSPAIFDKADPSPDGRHLLIARIVRPYSYLMPAYGFPKEVEVWNQNGKVEHKVASLPNEEQVPIEGVLTGPRDYEWIPTKPATLIWAEALDEGNPNKKADYRDRLMLLSAPFTSQPVELVKLQQRFRGAGFRSSAIEFGESGDWAFVHDYNRNHRWLRTFEIKLDQPGQEPKLIWERAIRDRYSDPGSPMMRTLANGKQVILQHGDEIYLDGAGASPKGDLPFLDRYDLASGKSERLFRSADKSYEVFVALLNDDGSRFITRFETPDDPPNLYIHSAQNGNEKTALTHFPNPTPELRGISKQLVTYKRDDGVQLSFELYLPADYKQGERLPTIVWAYPLEFNDASTAGQVSGSPYRFTTFSGISELFLVTQGYAVLDNATMPVIGDPETMNNTYVEQVVASAKAAIEKATEMGVTDPNRIGVGGHSYGAFMTANLLAHSDLFKAGVARSGAYNRTLTPFGFQSERRTFWQAEDMYLHVSPFAYADKIKTPILLIHGEADDNSGTFPIQSARMYEAIKGNGGTVRYVTLPYEAHGYLGLESVEHVQWEMIHWFDRWVKNASSGKNAVGR
ncbi:MAG TPA: prolyl oligopeptidase family serine peptidase [Terriglobales bacterium]|nr:prolyl oligopeptidase family serine peptidase [Terriglobales bacterium]